ncbi:TPR repeat region-containing protein [Streptomyces sp. WMMC897]|uniref:TPR repeat region-containing protein n=1 Tax=Streptomyces sp. WMMC897 TaxID=3014782 RepID=UPI0022B624C6|nr:hypothetical protein [Streptomyces sp. WMMC897]MCZ7413896.1 hypothetical protein [Streptomyces sp. WMMC897]
MSGFVITREALIEAAGCDPYELRTDFKNDSDPDAVDSLSSIFKNGADEAAESGSVAEYAAGLEERAGTRGSNAIYDDSAEHLQQTYDDLGESGLRTISNTLGEIKDEMETTITYLDDSIDGDMGLEYWREWYASQARQEIEAMEADLEELKWHEDYIWRGHGKTYNAEKFWFPTDVVIQTIEDAYTEQAGEYGVQVYDLMKGELDDYYGFLSNREQRLSEEGYDTGDSPVNVWFPPGRAEYEAEQLRIELNKEDPDPAAVARYTEGLENVMNGMLDENGQLRTDHEYLSDEELAFLEEYYDTLGADGLALLGNVGSDPYHLGPAGAEAIKAAQRAAANGLNVMTNPDVGGLDTNDPDQYERLPESVRTLLDNPEERLNQSLDEQVDWYRDFDGFGDLMGHATAPAGNGFSKDLANAAVWAQTGANAAEGYPAAADLDMSGAGRALHSVAQNEGASADLIIDEDFRQRMLGTDWQSHGGAADLIRSATLPPEGADPTARQKEAAYELLTAIAQDRENIANLEDPNGNGWGANHPLIESAITDTTLGYLDYLGDASNRKDADGNPFSYFDGEEGQFRLNGEDRVDLFQYVADSDQGVLNKFEVGLNTYYTVRAEEAFASGTSDDERRGILGDLGNLDGAVDLAYDQSLVDDQKSEDDKAKQQQKLGIAAATVITGVGAALAPASGGTSWGIAGAVVGGVGGLLDTPPEAEALAQELNYEAGLHGDWEIRSLVANAALEAGHGNSRSALEEKLDDHDVDSDGNPVVPGPEASDLGNVLDAVEGSYGGAAEVLKDDYRRGRGAASSDQGSDETSAD